jgi:membrane protease YdiL (CAAX protease family)
MYMNSQGSWKAKSAIACYFALLGGVLLASFVAALLLLAIGEDPVDTAFPVALVLLPITEGITFGITLTFAKRSGAGLRELGLRKLAPRAVAIIFIAVIALFPLGAGISIVEEIAFGPDPMSELLEEAIVPRGLGQLIAMVSLSLFLVGPVEELAFRGYVQKGLENSFGKGQGLLAASALFAVLHGLNSLYAILPVFVIALFLGFIWQRTDGNTTVSALIHGIYNSIGIAAAYFASI